MQYALNRNDKHVTKVKVRLADIKGPRGGVDKRCQIDVSLAGHNDIVIEDIETNLYVAIGRASNRCARTLSRSLARAREFSHETMNLPVTEELTE